MLDNDDKLAELELRAQRISSKSKTQDKSLGRRSARPKGSSTKKQSIGSLKPDQKHLISGTGKFEGINPLREKVDNESNNH